MTSVEWLEDKIQSDMTFLEILGLIRQAKEMEKEQIIDAYDAGLFDGSMDDVNDRIYKQYYNETFNKQ
jgi:hypothetical protein